MHGLRSGLLSCWRTKVQYQVSKIPTIHTTGTLATAIHLIMHEQCNTKLISDREREVLKLLAQGFTAKQIGKKLFISPTTVITHRKNIRNKLKCKNCPELIYKAVQLGIL